MGDDRRAPIEDASAAEGIFADPTTAPYREVREVQEAGMRDVEYTELRGGGGTLDDGVPEPVSADRERAGNRRKAIRSVGVVVGRRQGVGARRQADQITFAVGIRRVDGRDQAYDDPRHDDPYRVPAPPPHRSALHLVRIGTA